MEVLVVLAILVALSYGLVKLIQNRLQQAKESGRREAEQLGLVVGEVKRDIPFGTGFGQRYRLEARTCARYCLSHGVTGAPSWSLLMRPDSDTVPPFPPGWQLVVPNGSLSEQLQQELISVAKSWQEEFLELEGSGESVCAFWEEWGGVTQARRIYDYLQRLSTATKSFEG
jgi:hypothetical protein